MFLGQPAEEFQLLSLSTELLLLICELLDLTTLLVLAKASKRFHYLALPVYLARHGLPDSEPRSLALRSRAEILALPGLTLSLSITSLDHLLFDLDGVEDRFAWAVHHLLLFVHKLTEVRAVTLRLGNFMDYRWVDGFGTVNANPHRGDSDLTRLLTTILNRKCTSLTVIHGHFLASVLASIPAKAATATKRPDPGSSASSLTNLLKCPLHITHRRDTTKRVLYRNHLHTFGVHASILFMQPFYDWTIETLNTSNITSLSLRLSGMTSRALGVTLSNLTIPSLVTFAAETVAISFTDLHQFLLRHPSISHLHLHPHLNYHRSTKLPRRAKKKFLPQLTSVSGSARNIKVLLGQVPPSGLAQLQSITLSLPAHQRVFQSNDFEDLNKGIGEVLRSITPRELVVRFSLPFDKSREERLEVGENVASSFRSVEALTFCTDGHFAFVRWILPILPMWLTTFTSLRHLTLADDCAPSEPLTHTDFLRSVTERCPKLEIITLGAKEHRLLKS
ncbi:hypothetical protein Hypma_007949 [Hypsizygus marmoreus]|uniref:F-box domain-containing protein n=1 Tax=Hypsizygus marmoreus TaxID=39966 RepID=A0A369JZ74_HYPMA|nr:hypothetical protein Hypma_007949 [Hypsizygus marmoreus]